MRYQDMIVEAAGSRQPGKFTTRVLASPAGEMQPEEAVSVSYDDAQLQDSVERLANGDIDHEGMLALGRQLADLLLPAKQPGATTGVRDLFTASLLLVGQDGGLRLRLRLPVEIAPFPWEYMYVDPPDGSGGMAGFVALNQKVAIIRHEPMASPTLAPLASDRLKVVVALAAPANLPELNLEQEKSDLQKAFDGQPGIAPIFLENATLADVEGAIPRAAVFHFAGHGGFIRKPTDPAGTYTGTGELAFADALVGAEQLGINLKGAGIRLAVLGGCETGRRDGVNVWSGVAPALVNAEIPAVVGNQFAIYDESAIAFSRQLYQALVGGMPIEQAVSAGRLAVYNTLPAGRDWGAAVLYLRSGDGQIFSGAADDAVRQKAHSAATAVIQVKVNDVAAGATVLGARVGRMRRGELQVDVTTGAVAGSVQGATIGSMDGGDTRISTTADSVVTGGSITGAEIDLG